jgi:outer membrane lipoprotein-sorting protein
MTLFFSFFSRPDTVSGLCSRARAAARAAFVVLLSASLLAAEQTATAPTTTPASRAQKKTAWTLDAVLQQLDREAKELRSMTADLEKTKVTVVVNDRSTESGQMSLRTDGKMLIELTRPDARTILRNGDKLWIYLPKGKRLEEYDLGKHRAEVDELLSLGLGTSGNSLKKRFLLTLVGEESIDSRKTILLSLVPKDEKVRNQIDRIQLWIDTSNWLSVQQRIFETGSGDYTEIHYRNITANVKLPESLFKPRWPKDVTRVKPQA